MIAIALICLIGNVQDPAYEPGATFRLYDIGTPMASLMQLVRGQTPNVDVRIDAIDFETGTFPNKSTISVSDQERIYEDFFLVEILCEVLAPTTGAYQFRLTSDDGSNLTIDDELVLDNDGVHGKAVATGTLTLRKGWHRLKIRMFESSGGEILKCEWIPAGKKEFSVLGGEFLRVPSGIIRVVSPGRKKVATCAPETGCSSTGSTQASTS